jgi:hypothetical protein
MNQKKELKNYLNLLKSMKLFGFKKRKTLIAHFGFAWYPMFAWDKSHFYSQTGWVWLEKVWFQRVDDELYSGYQVFRVDKQGRPLNQKYE